MAERLKTVKNLAEKLTQPVGVSFLGRYPHVRRRREEHVVCLVAFLPTREFFLRGADEGVAVYAEDCSDDPIGRTLPLQRLSFTLALVGLDLPVHGKRSAENGELAADVWAGDQ